MNKENLDIVNHNKDAWNIVSENNEEWTNKFSKKIITEAKNGKWDVVLTQKKSVPKEWFPPLKGLKVLGLASGGGQQMPIFAALGAEVTSFDYSHMQLAKDKEVAAENNLLITTIEGDMRNLSVFIDNTFDLVFNPISTVYIPDVFNTYKETFRILKPGGLFMTGFLNPSIFLFDEIKKENKEFEIKYNIPFDPIKDYDPKMLSLFLRRKRRISYGHSLSQLIGYQNDVGFEIINFYEDYGKDPLNEFMACEIATCSRKPKNCIG